MEREVIGSTGGSEGRRRGGGMPAAAVASPGGRLPAVTAPRAAGSAPRIVDGRSEDRHPWAVAALVVPVLFCAIVGVGVYLMLHRNMGYFKPAPVGRSDALRWSLALAPRAPRPLDGAQSARAAATPPPMIRGTGRA